MRYADFQFKNNKCALLHCLRVKFIYAFVCWKGNIGLKKHVIVKTGPALHSVLRAESHRAEKMTKQKKIFPMVLQVVKMISERTKPPVLGERHTLHSRQRRERLCHLQLALCIRSKCRANSRICFNTGAISLKTSKLLEIYTIKLETRGKYTNFKDFSPKRKRRKYENMPHPLLMITKTPTSEKLLKWMFLAYFTLLWHKGLSLVDKTSCILTGKHGLKPRIMNFNAG